MKAYQGEKAIISLTSWKARIKTVGLTIYSLIKNCPGFHIVLVLSEEEFPKKEAELPDDLNVLADGNKIEILWVYRNYKSFKKVLFTMDKYREVPVISADDDIIYVDNYALLLYNMWITNPMSCVGLTANKYEWGLGLWGYAALFPPHFVDFITHDFIDKIIDMGCIDDDGLYIEIRYRYGVDAISCDLPFNNKYILGNAAAVQDNCITAQRCLHKQNDRDIYRRLLS